MILTAILSILVDLFLYSACALTVIMTLSAGQRPVAALIAAVPFLLYMGLLLKEKRYYLDQESARKRLRAGGVLLGVIVFLLFVFQKMDIFGTYFLPLFLCWLFTELFLLQILRHRESGALKPRFYLIIFGILGSVFLIAFIFTSQAVRHVLGQGIGWAYRNVIARVMIGVFYGVVYYCNMPKYFADVNINNNWIRCMDINNTYDVKILKSLSELYRFEPQILIYELEETQNTFMNPFYEKNVMLKKFNALQLIQMQIQRLLMDQVQNLNQNFMLTNNVMKVQDLSNQMVKFLIIPENWDYSEDNSIKILCHATSNDTIKKMINNFFTKLQKPRQAITKFTFNNNIIDPNSYLKLKDLCINSKSTIYAIKIFNFDLLKL